MKPKVAILGTGISSAYAYRACFDYKLKRVDVFNFESGKPGIGAFYLHWVPEDIQLKVPAQKVAYLGIGTAKVYMERQWPQLKHNTALRRNTKTSFPSKGLILEEGWNAKEVWELLWIRANIDTVAFKLSDADIKDLARTYDIVFQSFPSQAALSTQPVNALIPIEVFPKGANILNDKLAGMVEDCPNVIIYNGKEDSSRWVRASMMFGATSIEYPYTMKEEDIHLKKGGQLKVIQDIFPGVRPYRERIVPNVIPIGRFATYKRSYLSHDAYKQVWDAISLFDAGGLP